MIMKEEREYLYEVHLPVEETWIFHIKAKSAAEARHKMDNQQDYKNDVEQNCSIGGWTNAEGKITVKRIKKGG